MATLTIVSGPGAGETVDISPGTILEIGRKPTRSGGEPGTRFLVLDGDRKASRLHCKLHEVDGCWIVEDCGSSNGTFVNAERTARKTLKAGDLIRVGDSVLGWKVAEAPALAEELPVEEEPPEDLEDVYSYEEHRGLRVLLPAAVLLVIAAGLLAYLTGFFSSPPEEVFDVATPGRPEERSAPSPVPSAGETPATHAEEVTPEPIHVDPPPDVDSYIAEREYRDAWLALKAHGTQHPEEDLEPAKRKLLEAARAELARVRREVERLCAEGDLDGAHRLTEDIIVRVPGDLADEAIAILQLVGRAEGERIAKENDAREAPRLELEKQFLALRARWTEILARDPDKSESWEEICNATEAFVREWRNRPAYRQHSKELKHLYVAGKKRSLLLKRKATAFHASSVVWDGDSVVLKYDFDSPEELADFHAVGDSSSESRMEKGGLRLVGELRLLTGEPFHDRLRVRGTVRSGGYDPQAPNVNLALFTSAGDRLTRRGGQARSLLAPVGTPVETEPRGFVVFGLGYLTATEEYGGQKWEHLRIEGEKDPVSLPAHVVLTGWRGRLLHSDPREGLWALPIRPPLRGSLSFEVSLDGKGATWKLNRKTLVQPEDQALRRLRGLPARSGSVTLFTHGQTVRLDSLEVEGVVSKAWLGVAFGFGDSAREAFEQLESGER